MTHLTHMMTIAPSPPLYLITRHLNKPTTSVEVIGQVGQESHLHPAVLEDAARCSDSSKEVQFTLESADLDVRLSSVVQERPTAMQSVL